MEGEGEGEGLSLQTVWGPAHLMRRLQALLYKHKRKPVVVGEGEGERPSLQIAWGPAHQIRRLQALPKGWRKRRLLSLVAVVVVVEDAGAESPLQIVPEPQYQLRRSQVLCRWKTLMASSSLHRIRLQPMTVTCSSRWSSRPSLMLKPHRLRLRQVPLRE